MRKIWFNYDELCLYVSTYKIGIEGQGNTGTDYRTYIHMDIIGQAGRPLGIDTTHPIISVFIWIRIESEFLWII